MPRNRIIRAIPNVEEAVALIQSLPGNGTIVTLEALQAQHDLERQLACRELDEMAKQFAREDEERRRLWGTKFPRRLGDKPPENGKSSKSINPVKAKKGKRSGTSGKVGKFVGVPLTTKKS